MRFLKILFISAIIIIFNTNLNLYAEPYNRIISLAPNITEILYALGLDDRIVGVTSFCDYPPQAKEKQKIGGMSNPSIEAIISLKPDIVILTTDGNPKEVDLKLRKLGIKTYVFKERQLNELPDGIRKLGKFLDEELDAENLADKIEKVVKLKFKNQNTK